MQHEDVSGRRAGGILEVLLMATKLRSRGGKTMVTVTELADAAGCTVQAIHKAIGAGRIIGWIRMGPMYLIPIQEANRWISEREKRNA